MRHGELVVEDIGLSIDDIGSANLQAFFEPTDALKPHQLHGGRIVSEVAHEPLTAPFPDLFDTQQAADHLSGSHIGMELFDFMELGAVDIAVRIMLEQDRKSTRLNSSHVKISYAVFCL